MGTSQAKNNMKKTRKAEVSHLQARRDDDGVEEDQRWASEMKNKGRTSKNNKMEALRTTMVLSVSNGQRGGGSRPINRTFSTGSRHKLVLNGHPLAPVHVTNRC